MQMKTTVLTDILTVTYVSSQILYYLYSGFEEQQKEDKDFLVKMTVAYRPEWGVSTAFC